MGVVIVVGNCLDPFLSLHLQCFYLTRIFYEFFLLPQITSHGGEYEMVSLENEPGWVFVRGASDGDIV